MNLVEYQSRLVGQLPVAPSPYPQWWELPRQSPGFRYARYVQAELDRVNMLMGHPGSMKGAEWWMGQGDG